MDKKRAFTILAAGLILMGCAGHLMAQSTLDTALTYQGFLKRNNSPVNRMMDLRFALFADPNATQHIGGQIEAIGVDVIDGHFALELDFGADPFTGEPRWLQTEVRRNGTSDPYEPQTPLLRLTLSPYAIYAARAGHVQDGITGRGTAGSIPRFTDPNTIGDSVIFQNAGNVGIGTQTPNERLSVNGVIESTGGIRFPDNSVQTSAAGAIPRGLISMWSGSVDDIPNDWALCDGRTYTAPNGNPVTTPNLMSQFIRSIGDASTAPGATGGAASHDHGAGSYTVSSHAHSASSGTHTHPYRAVVSNCGGIDPVNDVTQPSPPGTDVTADGGGAVTGRAASEDYLPPHYELAFIMKL